MYNLKAILNELMDIDGLEVLAKPDKLIVSATDDGTILCSVTKQKYITYSDHYLYTGAINTIVNENKSFDTLKFAHELRDEFGCTYEEFGENNWIVKNKYGDIILTVNLPTVDTEWNGFINLPLEQQHRVYQILGEHVK